MVGSQSVLWQKKWRCCAAAPLNRSCQRTALVLEVVKLIGVALNRVDAAKAEIFEAASAKAAAKAAAKASATDAAAKTAAANATTKAANS